MPAFRQVTIVGLGLIGGSLGMALRRRRVARKVVGLSRRASTVRRARSAGAIDAGTTDPAAAVRGADLVVLATPVDLIAPTARRLARFMRSGSVLTDVGSTKAHIVETLGRRLPRGIPFVGAHPLAGSERQGLDAASARLFEGSVCILTPAARMDRRAVQMVRRLWAPLVGRVATMSPRQHDRLLAGTSHLPHLVAVSLSLSAGAAPFVAPSLLDLTRIAQSDPDLWDDIFLTNRQAVLAAMARFERAWRRLRSSVARSDRAALRRLLRRAQAIRHAFER